MDIPSVSEWNQGRVLPPIEGPSAVRQAFGPNPGFPPVDSETILLKLAKPTPEEVPPSYKLAGMAVIRAAAAAQRK